MLAMSKRRVFAAVVAIVLVGIGIANVVSYTADTARLGGSTAGKAILSLPQDDSGRPRRRRRRHGR